MARKSSVPVKVSAPDLALVKARSEGMQIVSPLQPLVMRLVIKSSEDYLAADTVLARIKNARKLWATKIDPIRDPIDRAIKDLKESLTGIKALDVEVDGPLELLEAKVRTKMKDYKTEELRLIEDARRLQEEDARRLREQAERAAQQARIAKTPQMKAKLEQVRADLEVQATITEEDYDKPVQGGTTSTRVVQKVRIVDPVAFVASLEDYAPRADLYRMEHPPLTVLTHKIHKIRATGQTELVEDESALDVMRAEVSKIFAVQPGVVQSWPGVEVYDDVIIASH